MKLRVLDTISAVEPAFLSGFRLGDWLGLLARNSFSVDRRYLGRAVAATVGATLTSILSRFEPNQALTAEQEGLWQSPIFVLGLARSGTTHLHNLLLCNPALACPSRLDCYNPHTLETLHRLGVPRWLALVPEKKRLVDNVVAGWNSAEEDEVALAITTGDGPRLGLVFGRRHKHYRHRSPLDPAWDGSELWQQALAAFTRKLVRLRNKTLVLKSPSHIAFVPEILAVFPEARFVTIFRNPLDQIRSLLAAEAHHDWCALQAYTTAGLRMLAKSSGELLHRYFQTRGMVPSRNLFECTYESLVESPLAVLEEIHKHLRIPGFQPIRAKLEDRCAAGKYVRNVHSKLSEQDEDLVWLEFQSLVERGFYNRNR